MQLCKGLSIQEVLFICYVNTVPLNGIKTGSHIQLQSLYSLPFVFPLEKSVLSNTDYCDGWCPAEKQLTYTEIF